MATMAGLSRVRNTVTTPIGDLILVAGADGVLHGAEWADCLERLPAELRAASKGCLPDAVLDDASKNYPPPGTIAR